MDNYNKLVEEQNEELKQKLAREQTKMNDMALMCKIYEPRWDCTMIPLKSTVIDENEKYAHRFGGHLFVYANVRWNTMEKSYYIKWLLPILERSQPKDCYYPYLNDAKEIVEKRFYTEIDKIKTYLESKQEFYEIHKVN